MPNDKPRALPFCSHDLRRLSVESYLDPRTIGSYFKGRSVRPTVAARIKEALAKLGLPDRTDTPEATAPSSPPASEPATSPEV